MAAMASDTALTNRASHATPRARPVANITIMVMPAAAATHRLRLFNSLVRGDISLVVVLSRPEIFPTSVSLPVAVTMNTPLPWVTGVFMNTMFERSPGARSPAGRGPVSFAAGVLSPVNDDSSTCREMAVTTRPSAGTWSPALSSTTSPTTSWSAGISRSIPSRLTRVVAFMRDLRAFMALSAFPSCRIATTALKTVSRIRTTAVLHCLMASETMAAPESMSCM